MEPEAKATEQDIRRAHDLIEDQIFDLYGIDELDYENLVEQDDDGNYYENLVHFLTEEDWKKLYEETMQDILNGKFPPELEKICEGLEDSYYDYCSPYFELDRGIYTHDKPAICFFSKFLGEASDFIDDEEEFEDDED